MTIAHISNLNGMHRELDIPGVDMLVCSGGLCTGDGDNETIISFIRWFDQQKPFYKIFIGGSEDWGLDACNSPNDMVSREIIKEIRAFEATNGHHYLYNNGIVCDGVNIWGSPYSLCDVPQAFLLESKKDAVQCWNKIPKGTDILITPEPSKNTCDLTIHSNYTGYTGDPFLAERIAEIKPKLHLCGGYLAGRGYHYGPNTITLNSSCYDPVTNTIREPRVFSYQPKSKKVEIYKEKQYLV